MNFSNALKQQLQLFYKNQKKNFLLGNYQPIALKNTLEKLLEKIVTKWIQETAKAYKLLP